ncbi:MAG: PLP-dependent aminotransferase family protein [Rhodospirillales bacterium]|nr:PLP-dependent aminotransferase family protein [Rhodospirillales bacterium]MCW8862324.1 PLP-dependent aminotransferase family protein [Rhodospirillales bacterium]MCW8951301.1 PLP-dependent aminotransferase family protein [Rhodospirillales bacterium]MCW8969946.1 PLP-dependent aminotransferase family protein [Rhodospirillales bacterium]MCW9003556.1 PLP-dependent aminotransferase family protein [Rhodospirillales bacterium]
MTGERFFKATIRYDIRSGGGVLVQLPVQLDSKSSHSLQRQLFEKIRKLILSGVLRPGTLVPATRALANQLQISRNTVMLAYERLITEGYLQSKKAVGTFVSFDIPETSILHAHGGTYETGNEPPPLPRQPVIFTGQAHALANLGARPLAVDFWIGRPDPGSFPSKTWRRLIARHLSKAVCDITDYGDPAGLPSLRKAIADHIALARGITAKPEQVMIVSGAQEALNIIARLFVKTGTPVAVECPCYQGAVYLMESFGAKLLPVPIEQDGIDVRALPKRKTALIYVTPSHQYPLGVTLSLEKRIRLLDWSRHTGAYIIEDDYDSDFRYQGSPLTALKGLSGGEGVIYLGTFSKSIGAGLRTGYMVLPDELIEPAGIVKALMNNGHPWLVQSVLCDFMTSGGYAAHLRKIRRTYMSRRDRLIEELNRHFGEVDITGREAGMHIAWHLPSWMPKAIELQEIAQQKGIGIYSLMRGAAVCLQKTTYDQKTILLGFSSTTEEKISFGIGEIATAIHKNHAPQD